MSTLVDRYCPPALPDDVSWNATPSPPLSKFSACTVPGIAAGVPEYGVGDAVPPPPLPPATTVTESMLKPAVSAVSVICCVPAPSVIGTDTVVQFCQPPVAGTVTGFEVLLVPLNATCSVAPLGDATRRLTV